MASRKSVLSFLPVRSKPVLSIGGDDVAGRLQASSKPSNIALAYTVLLNRHCLVSIDGSKLAPLPQIEGKAFAQKDFAFTFSGETEIEPKP
ncbi:MAG: hypothetical protein HC835_17540 [Oscillatoriales cyanobacterium RM2_1_1]|nr:hypothetical protein [Oscillatoriales cyanobacterium RM2_1_1]